MTADKPVVSIITAVRNNKDFIEDAINSVLNQSYPHIEYIIIDGGSTDGTQDIIKKYEGRIARRVSEPDNGIYDAMNKGIELASGDIIGFLHSDDMFTDNSVIDKIAGKFKSDNVDAVYSDIFYVSRSNTEKVIRYWKAGRFDKKSLIYGWMPPHPALFIRREVYKKYGCFNSGMKIAADYDIVLRFISKYKISVGYINEVLVKMRLGGKSNKSMMNIIKKSKEDYAAMKTNGLPNPLFSLFMKNFRKIPQFITRSS
jgi:glycosyltransferase